MTSQPLAPRAQLAWDTILQRPTTGIPSWLLHVMEHRAIESLADAEAGRYRQAPDDVYVAMQRRLGTCMLDQYLADNPLQMGTHGYETPERGATTGAHRIEVDGLVIDSPEAVVEHLERYVFPALEREAVSPLDEGATVDHMIAHERQIQRRLGHDILKVPYGVVRFPSLAYGTYGYEAYFMAYALYPEVIEHHFALQADAAVPHNRAVARAYRDGGLPPLCRLDHDMADSRGTLVRVETLERMWLPHVARAIAPLLDAGVRLIWHCDGNLMQLLPRLFDIGLAGYQGFQYEDGMDYPRLCRMTTRDGQPPIVIAGVSVTTTMAHGTPADVRRELDWLVAEGPPVGLFLGASSSIVPGTPLRNIEALAEGLAHYRQHGMAR